MRIEPGIKVRARGLLWEVRSAEPCGAQTLVSLRCAAGDLAGLEWELLHPLDPIVPANLAPRVDQPGTAAQWRLHHIAALLRQDPGPGLPLADPPPGVIPEPYQFVPLLRALAMPRPRLLLADGVGLGKTVQAGLIVAELVARRRAHRAIVVVPSGPLLAQWAAELRTRFGLRPDIIADAAALRARGVGLESGANPFDATSLVLTTPDFAKQETVMELLDRTSWDIAILDEAHHFTAGATDGEATQRRRLAEVLAARAEGLLLLTATPHDGDDRHFASLLALLDPTLVGPGGLPLGQAYRGHVVRRLKAHLRDPQSGAPLFRPRHVVPVPVGLEGPLLAPVRAFHQGLADVLGPRLRGQGGEAADTLAFTGLLKRSVSTIAAAVATLRVVADRHAANAALPDTPARRRDRARVMAALRRRAARQGTLSAQEEDAQAALETQGMAAALSGASAAALRGLVALGEAAAPFDPKLDCLVREIAAVRAAEPGANVLVYTEYADSLDAARAALLAAGQPVLVISGRDSDTARARAADRFAAEPDLVLLSTDALAEGLNLHRFCHHLLHLDLPYNPNRLEQRNGRIDRYGQARDPVVLYPYLAGTFEERLLLRLIAKYEKARAALDEMPPTLPVTASEDGWATSLVRGFAEEQAPLFPPPPSALRGLEIAAEAADFATWRMMRREIDRAYAAFDQMAVRHGWLSAGAASTGAPARTVLHRALRGESPAAFLKAAGVEPLAGAVGWSHPSIGGAADRILACAWAAGPDPRVAAARHPDGPMLLATWTVECAAPAGIALRRCLATLVGPSVAPRLVADPASWLALAGEPAEADWARDFAPWVAAELARAGSVVLDGFAPILDAIRTTRARGVAREQQTLGRWITAQAVAVCGAAEPELGELFDDPPRRPAWRAGADPVRRLAAYAADASRPAASRAEAREALAFHEARCRTIEASAIVGAPALMPAGLLMLVP